MPSPSLSNVSDVTESRILSSHAFGDVELTASAITRLIAPLWGFPERVEYALLPAAREGLYWFQSVEDELTTFILADPFVLKPSYALDLSDSDRQMLSAESADEILALVMLTLPITEDGRVTANFRAPLVFNLRSGVGVQLVISDESQGLREEIDLAIFPKQDDGLKML